MQLKRVTLKIGFLSGITASAAVQAAPQGQIGNDERCLTMARYGHAVAESKSLGLSEQRIKEVSLRGRGTSPTDVEISRTEANVISYIFTVDLKPEDARKVIYNKCKAGDFYGIR